MNDSVYYNTILVIMHLQDILIKDGMSRRRPGNLIYYAAIWLANIGSRRLSSSSRLAYTGRRARRGTGYDLQVLGCTIGTCTIYA